MDKVYQIISGALALLVLIGIFVLIGLGKEVPSEIWAAFGPIVGFFFGKVPASSGSSAKV